MLIMLIFSLCLSLMSVYTVLLTRSKEKLCKYEVLVSFLLYHSEGKFWPSFIEKNPKNVGAFVGLCLYGEYMALDPFWWAILGFKMSRNRGKHEESGDKKTKKRKKTKSQDMKNTHLLGGCLFGACFAVKLGIF